MVSERSNEREGVRKNESLRVPAEKSKKSLDISEPKIRNFYRSTFCVKN